MRRRGLRGFTLIELLVGMAFGGILTLVALAALAHITVDTDAAAKAIAVKKGLESAKIVERHDVFAWAYGCTSKDALVIKVEGLNAQKQPETVTVCCRGWYKDGCSMPDEAEAAQ